MTSQYKLPDLKEDYGVQSSLSYDMFDSLDYGFDSGWKTKQVILRSIRTRMSIHPNARYKDKGVDHFLQFVSGSYLMEDLWGRCRSNYNEKLGLLEVEIVRKDGLDKNQTEFTRGHEEAHAMVFLGQMSRLFEEAQKLGLTFDFFSQYDSERNDKSVNRLMHHQGTKNDADALLWRKNFILDESIANIGGLVGLIKSHADHNLISKVRTGIQRMEMNPYPV
jgi:hypothetical protein